MTKNIIIIIYEKSKIDGIEEKYSMGLYDTMIKLLWCDMIWIYRTPVLDWTLSGKTLTDGSLPQSVIQLSIHSSFVSCNLTHYLSTSSNNSLFIFKFRISQVQKINKSNLVQIKIHTINYDILNLISLLYNKTSYQF